LRRSSSASTYSSLSARWYTATNTRPRPCAAARQPFRLHIYTMNYLSTRWYTATYTRPRPCAAVRPRPRDGPRAPRVWRSPGCLPARERALPRPRARNRHSSAAQPSPRQPEACQVVLLASALVTTPRRTAPMPCAHSKRKSCPRGVCIQLLCQPGACAAPPAPRPLGRGPPSPDSAAKCHSHSHPTRDAHCCALCANARRAPHAAAARHLSLKRAL